MLKKTGDWDKAEKALKNLNKLAVENFAMATKQSAYLLRDAIRLTIRRGRSEWPPLSPLTIERKRSSKPLNDYGDLAFSVDVIKVNKYSNFIGISRFAKNSKGQSMVNIAAVHEFGAEIQPKNGQALAIPVSRYASDLAEKYGGVRHIPGLFRPTGKNILAMSDGSGFIPMFILKKSVKIPARSFIESTFRDERKKIQYNWLKAAKKSLRGEKLSV